MLPRRRKDRRLGWSAATPVVFGAAGLLFSLTAATAHGTDLRDDRRPELTNLIAERKQEIATSRARAARLRGEIEAQQQGQAGADTAVDEQRRRGESQLAAAGLTAVHGPGVVVVLNDAPRRPDGSRPAGARPDDLVVHQQDVQAVVNALWAGGAEAMTLMGVRVISTSAVRCVGNTLLLDGQVYSPRSRSPRSATRRASSARSTRRRSCPVQGRRGQFRPGLPGADGGRRAGEGL